MREGCSFNSTGLCVLARKQGRDFRLCANGISPEFCYKGPALRSPAQLVRLPGRIFANQSLLNQKRQQRLKLFRVEATNEVVRINFALKASCAFQENF